MKIWGAVAVRSYETHASTISIQVWDAARAPRVLVPGTEKRRVSPRKEKRSTREGGRSSQHAISSAVVYLRELDGAICGRCGDNQIISLCLPCQNRKKCICNII